MEQEAVAAIRAWTRLDQAIAEFNRVLEREHGVTGAQLAILRLVREWSSPVGPGLPGRVTLGMLRERLVMHPASLGQLLDRLARRGLVVLTADPDDRRRRVVQITTTGARVLDEAPLAGPVRLRHVSADPSRLRRLTQAFDDAIDLFGLEEYDSDAPANLAEHRSRAGGGSARGGSAGRGDAAPDRGVGSGQTAG